MKDKLFCLLVIVWVVVSICSTVYHFKNREYRSKQIDELIFHDEELTNVVAEQLIFEKSIAKEKDAINSQN